MSFAPAQEVQQHGVVFEQWIRDTFFDAYEPESYTQKWDIPAAANIRHGGLPVNPKAAKYRGPVALGDTLRQYDIDQPFILLVGFWEQDGPHKRFVNITQLMVFSNNMEYAESSPEPLEGAYYATTARDAPSFNYFREEEKRDLAKLLTPEDPDTETLILSDNNLTSIRHSPEYATNKNPDTPTNYQNKAAEEPTPFTFSPKLELSVRKHALILHDEGTKDLRKSAIKLQNELQRLARE